MEPPAYGRHPSSRPKKSPKALPEELVAQVIAKRLETRRCAEVVHTLLVREGVDISLSSVKRICGTYCAPLKRKSVWARKRKYPPRPNVTHPGALVQMDTIHFFDAKGTKKYIYTALDVYTRMGFALAAPRIGNIPSARFFDRTRDIFRFQSNVCRPTTALSSGCGSRITQGVAAPCTGRRTFRSSLNGTTGNGRTWRLRAGRRQKCSERFQGVESFTVGSGR